VGGRGKLEVNYGRGLVKKWVEVGEWEERGERIWRESRGKENLGWGGREGGGGFRERSPFQVWGGLTYRSGVKKT